MNALEVTPMQKLIGLAFEIRSKTETKFSIELGSMEFIWRDEIEEVSSRYYQDICYHQQETYADSHGVNTGDEFETFSKSKRIRL